MFSRFLIATLFVFFVGTNAWSAEIYNGPPRQPRSGFENEKEYVQYLNKSVTWYKDYSNTLKTLSAKLNKKVNEPNLYIVLVPNNDLKARYIATDKSTALDITLTSYLGELRKSDKPFRKQELKSRIKKMQQYSSLIKRDLRLYIDELDQMASHADSLRVSFEDKLRSQQNKPIPKRNGTIKVVSATYGLNCNGFRWKKKPAYVVKKGNATSKMKECNGKSKCTYKVDVKVLKFDPAFGCEKEFDVEYKCLPSQKIFKVKVPKEAGWGTKSADLSCK